MVDGTFDILPVVETDVPAFTLEGVRYPSVFFQCWGQGR
jgi:hypothetical protein